MSQHPITRTPRSNTSPGLRASGWFAAHPSIGTVMCLLGLLVFSTLAYSVWTNGPLVQEDVTLARQMHVEAVNTSSRIIEFLIFGFFVGKELLQVIVVILAVYFIHKRFWPELAILLIGSAGGALIWSFLIGVFDRQRPAQQIGIVVTDQSFPSGHALSSVICYGFLAYLLVPKMPSLFWKWAVVITSVLVMLFVGYSRIFLGGHYLTDILAGYGLGLAWGALVFTLVERFFLREQHNAG